jgi:hypothetical protein
MLSPQGERSESFECVEIYVPKKLETLSALYSFLSGKLAERSRGISQEVAIDGFSLYEVDGAFFGDHIDQERTIVIRILLALPDSGTGAAMISKIEILGGEIAPLVALQEEELWICHYPQQGVNFRPPRSSAPSQRTISSLRR